MTEPLLSQDAAQVQVLWGDVPGSRGYIEYHVDKTLPGTQFTAEWLLAGLLLSAFDPLRGHGGLQPSLSCLHRHSQQRRQMFAE